MAFSAGEVVAVLGGRFNPAGFAQYDAAVKKTIASAGAAEKAMVASGERSAAAQAALGAAATRAAGQVTAAAAAQQRAALAVQRAQLAADAAVLKYGKSSIQAERASLSLAGAQNTLAAANRRLAAAQAAAVEANLATAGSAGKGSAALGLLGRTAKTGALVGVAALAYGLGKSVSVAANFEQAMADVQAVTKANAADMKRLSNAALNLGAKTGVGATKAAGALAELAKGGLSTEQTIGALAGTIAMSQAGSMDLSVAANTVAQALNLFAMKGSEASHVADAFATAANKTTADVSFFAQGLAQGGLAAKNAGLNFDETTAALETLAAAGFKSGSDAGTSLKTALTQLSSGNKRTKEELDRLNISLFNTKGSLKPLPAISRELGRAWKDMSDKNRVASAAALVGQDGMRALLALYDQGPKKIRGFERGLAAQGTAQDVANAKMDNLKGSWQKFTAQLQTMAIKVGTAMLPTLKSVTDAVTVFFDSLNRGNLRSTGFGRFLDDARAVISPVLGILRGLAQAAALALGALGRVPGMGAMKIAAKEASAAADAIGGIKNAIDGIGKPKPIKFKAEADVSRAIRTLARMEGTKLGDKVVQVIANDGSAKQKIRALIALGIPSKQARVIVLGAEQAAGKIASVRDLMSTLSDKTVTLTTIIRKINQGGPSGFSKTPTNASGRGPGATGAALVGEGGGPEWVGNPRDGWSLASGPQILDLGASDYVIPTEPKYRGRALGLLADALGIPGFAKGKRPKAIHSQPIQYAEYLGPLESEVQKWQERVTRDQQAKDDKKDKKLTKKAKEARRKLPREKQMLAQAKRELASAKEYGAKIQKQEELANIYADDMDLAKTDSAWKLARNRRTGALGREAKLLADALKLAGGPTASSAWARALRKKLGETNVGIQNANADSFDVAKVGTFNEDEQKALDKVDADIALAQLTDTKADDILMLGAKERLLVPLLAKAQKAGRSGAVAEIAGLLKQTRDEITDAKRVDVTADQQLTTDQAFQRGLAQGRTTAIDRTIDRAFGPQIVVNTLHPGDPATVRAIGDAAAAGFGYQQPRPASTARVGV